MTTERTAELLVEIRVEEIPARMHANIQKDFENCLEDLKKAVGGNIQTSDGPVTSDVYQETPQKFYITPRRIALVWSRLPLETPQTSVEKKGPRVDAAFEADGKTPTKALEGFLKSTQATLAQLGKRHDGKNEIFFFRVTTPRRPTADVLAELLPTAIKNIPWPKSMRWGNGTLTFVRPIENIAAVFDGKPLKLALENVPTDPVTVGHAFLDSGTFALTTADAYVAELKNRKVIVDHAERRAEIEKQLTDEARKHGATLVANERLLDEVTGLVEMPHVVAGTFDAAFLQLPKELLISVMVTHQRFFALEKDGTLLNTFLGVSNMPDTKGYVRQGYEKVITARFNDAKFYWDTDRKANLESRIPALKNVVFHQKLGTLFDKAQRLEALVGVLAPSFPGVNRPLAERAARLCKADLTSGVVAEFPELQGIMGGYYATHDGEPAPVVAALRHHYAQADFAHLPPEALLVMVADRFDTLVGFFAIDEAPTGSKDPFALRRAALGVLKLLEQHGLRLHLRPALQAAASGYGRIGENKALDVAKLETFFMTRLQVLLKDDGIGPDRVDAVFSLGLDDTVDVARRARALEAFMKTPDGAALHAGYKRAANVLAKAEKSHGLVDTALLKEPAEKDLFLAYEKAAAAVDVALKAEDYAAAMTALAALRAPVDAFFAGVMVMADEAALRHTRVALVQGLVQLFGRVAVFGKLAG